MIEPLTVEERPAVQAAVIHLVVARDAIQSVMDPAIREVFAAVMAQGIGPAGSLFDHHQSMHPDTFDFEVGVPVSDTVTEDGRVHASTLPAGRVVRTVYHGGYEGLGEAWGEFDAAIAAAGRAAADELWEIFLVGPESAADASGYRTELVRPLRA